MTSTYFVLQVKPHPTSGMTYAGKHSLSGLSAAGQYEAHVLTLNGEGWSRQSKNFQFATFGAGTWAISAGKNSYKDWLR